MLSDDFGAFMSTGDGIKKLEGFSGFEFGAKVQSYIRKYFSKNQSSVDITESLPEIRYTFDRMKNNIVHDLLAEVSDQGLTGNDAICELVFVDFSEFVNGKYNAVKQSFVVKCTDRRPENGFLDYSGSFIAKGNLKKGHFILNDDLKSGEFIEERGGILCD